jgi:hypothetical protein
MSLLYTTTGARYNLGVVGEKTEPLVWVDHQLITIVALKINEKLVKLERDCLESDCPRK